MGQLQFKERAKTEDPDKLKVEAWKQGKEENVRALLSSLQDVLWEGHRFKPVNLAEVCLGGACFPAAPAASRRLWRIGIILMSSMIPRCFVEVG